MKSVFIIRILLGGLLSIVPAVEPKPERILQNVAEKALSAPTSFPVLGDNPPRVKGRRERMNQRATITGARAGGLRYSLDRTSGDWRTEKIILALDKNWLQKLKDRVEASRLFRNSQLDSNFLCCVIPEDKKRRTKGSVECWYLEVFTKLNNLKCPSQLKYSFRFGQKI